MADGTKALILVADDEPSLRRATERALTSFGFAVVAAGSGLEALALLKQRHGEIALVLTDHMMPEFTGADLYREARAAGITTPFLVTTGYSVDELGEKGFGLDVFRLMKPWSLEELWAAVQEALRR